MPKRGVREPGTVLCEVWRQTAAPTCRLLQPCSASCPLPLLLHMLLESVQCSCCRPAITTLIMHITQHLSNPNGNPQLALTFQPLVNMALNMVRGGSGSLKRGRGLGGSYGGTLL